MIRITLDGQRFGKLVVVHEVEPRRRPSGQRARYFYCACDCGKGGEFCLGQLRSGHTKSCGCGIVERVVQRNTTHGLSKDFRAEYLAWKGMRKRCSMPSGRDFKYYAGRGISVCERWESFDLFLADMGIKPSPAHSLDRWPNRDGDYEPGNCRWATAKDQSRNRDIAIVVSLDGQTAHLADVAERTGIKRGTLYARRRAGWPDEKLATPVGERRADD